MRIGVGLSIPELATRGGRFSPASLFTSGVAGAWYDPSDVLLNWRTNLLTYSQEFDNAAWTKVNVTAANTSSTTAPDGTTTADTITGDGTNAVHEVRQIITATGSAIYAISVYLKQNTERYAYALMLGRTVTDDNGDLVFVDLQTGTILSSSGSGTSATLSSVGSGWYRLVIPTSAYPASSQIEVRMGVANAPSSQASTASGSVYIWGAQLELGSTATTYQAITTPEQTYLLYDPQPVLYQDSAGTTPVTAVEQPVGLMLDKSQGLVLGSEIVTGAASAYSGNGTVSTVGDTITATCTTNGIYGITWASTFVSNLWVVLTVEVVTNSASKSLLIFPNGNATALAGGTTTGNKSFITLAPTATGSTRCPIFYINGLVGESFSIRLTSIKVIPGNHASQATAASRPVLRARYNLLTYSEQFDNAAWSKGNTTVTANQTIAPDGTTTADLLYPSTSGAARNIYQQATLASAVYNVSVYAKPSGKSWIAVGSLTGATTVVYFNVSSGTVGTVGSGLTGTITSVGNGWYRCTVSNTAAVSNPYLQAWVVDADGSLAVTANGTDGVYIWGADLRTGSSAGTYQRIAAATDYATAGFLPYLYFVTDDSFGTNSIDFASGPTNPPLGSEQYVTGTAPWSRGFFSVDGTISAAGTAVTITQGAGDTAGFRWVQPITCEVGQYYRLYAGSITLTGGTSALIGFTANSSGTGITSDNSISDTQDPLGKYIVATATTMYVVISLSGGVTGNSATFNNISVAKLTNSAYAPDKMSVCAGVTKLSDAASAMVAELSANAVLNAGAFNIQAPATGGNAEYRYGGGGTIFRTVLTSSYAAPITNVLAATQDIVGDSMNLRVNGVSVGTSALDQGTGNFGNYPLFIGRRNNSSTPFNGNLYQLIVCGKTLSASELASTEAYVATKTGVTL